MVGEKNLQIMQQPMSQQKRKGELKRKEKVG